MTAADLAQAAASGRLKTLIVGAGIAGTALAALMKRWGEEPAIVERSKPGATAGYNLGIYPVGSGILHGLGLYPCFADSTVAMRHYQLFNGAGEQLHELDLSAMFDQYGPMLGIRRGELIAMLARQLEANQILYNTTITALAESDDAVAVTFNDGSIGTLTSWWAPMAFIQAYGT